MHRQGLRESSLAKGTAVLQEPPLDRDGDLVPVGHREFWADGDVQLGNEPVAEPADARFSDVFHPRGLLGRLPDLVNTSGSTPSSNRRKTDFAESHTILKIIRVMNNPTSGSASG